MDIEDKLIELGFKRVIGFKTILELGKIDLYYYETLKEFVVYNNDSEEVESTFDEGKMIELVEKYKPSNVISMSGKVQTNEDGINVVVETEVSSNRHISHLDKPVTITKILDRRDIEIEGEKVMQRLRSSDDERDWAKLHKFYADLVKTQEGFAISNCNSPHDVENAHSRGDIMKYKLD